MEWRPDVKKTDILFFFFYLVPKVLGGVRTYTRLDNYDEGTDQQKR